MVQIQLRFTDEQLAEMLEAIDLSLTTRGYNEHLSDAWFRCMDALAECTALAMPPNEELELLYPPECEI